MVTDIIAEARKANFSLLKGILNTKLEQQKTDITKSEHPKFEKLLENDSKLKDLYEGNWQSYDFKSRSEAEQSLVTILCMNGFSDDEIRETMKGCKIGKWQEKDSSYHDLSIEKARQFAAKHELSNEEQEDKGDIIKVPHKLDGNSNESEIKEEEDPIFDGGQGGQKGHPYKEIIPMDFLQSPTTYLPHFEDFRTSTRLLGIEYIPILKAKYYSILSTLIRRSRIRFSRIITDCRIHTLIPLMTGRGKTELKRITKQIVEKELELLYWAVESKHPEQLVGKILRHSNDGEVLYEEILGFLSRNYLEIDEGLLFMRSETEFYQEIRKYIRTALDGYGNNEITKKAVEIPFEHSLRYHPDVIVSFYLQPERIPDARVKEGDLARFVIPYIDMSKIDHSDNLKTKAIEDYNLDEEKKKLELYVSFIKKLKIEKTYSATEEAKKRFGELSILLYKYGTQFSERVNNYTHGKLYRLQNFLAKFAAIQAFINNRNEITVEDVEKGFIDYFEILSLEFRFIESKIEGFINYGEDWSGAADKDQICLRWLAEKEAFDEQSKISIGEYKEEIENVFHVEERQTKRILSKQKKYGWVDTKTGHKNSAVWLTFKPKIKWKRDEQFVIYIYKIYSELVRKYSDIPYKGVPYDPYDPTHKLENEEPSKQQEKDALGISKHDPFQGKHDPLKKIPIEIKKIILEVGKCKECGKDEIDLIYVVPYSNDEFKNVCKRCGERIMHDYGLKLSGGDNK